MSVNLLPTQSHTLGLLLSIAQGVWDSPRSPCLQLPSLSDSGVQNALLYVAQRWVLISARRSCEKDLSHSGPKD